MKKVIIGATLLAVSLCADVKTILPYAGLISYDSSSEASDKDKARLFGVHASTGDLSYLLEFDYAHINTKYKDSTVADLSQDDITLTYAKYNKNFMTKIGIHHISTNDVQLGDGNVIIASIGGYRWSGEDKYSYGLDGYYSFYKDGHDENYLSVKSIHILQVSPYISIFKSLGPQIKNSFVLKANYQYSNNYVDKDYLSYEISDTLYYNDYFGMLKIYGGEMRSGVKDGGFTVYNTLDLMKSGLEVKLGYYLNKNAVFSVSYGQNNYKEYGLTQDGTSSVAVASLSYTY